MMPAHPPSAGPISKITDWFSDLVAVPRRVKRLANKEKFDRDPRPACRSCGMGRIGGLRPSADPAIVSIGACTHCSTLFSVDQKGAVGQVLSPDAG